MGNDEATNDKKKIDAEIAPFINKWKSDFVFIWEGGDYKVRMKHYYGQRCNCSNYLN